MPTVVRLLSRLIHFRRCFFYAAPIHIIIINIRHLAAMHPEKPIGGSFGLLFLCFMALIFIFNARLSYSTQIILFFFPRLYLYATHLPAFYDHSLHTDNLPFSCLLSALSPLAGHSHAHPLPTIFAVICTYAIISLSLHFLVQPTKPILSVPQHSYILSLIVSR